MTFRAMSNIRASVEWGNPTVFAGEVIECRITFKNTSSPSSRRLSTSAGNQIRAQNSARERWKDNTPAQTAHTTPRNGGHRRSSTVHTIGSWTKASFNDSSNLDQVTEGPGLESSLESRQYAAKHRQRRSVSIVSISGDFKPSDVNTYGQYSKRPLGTHSRTASLHVLPRRTLGLKDGSIASIIIQWSLYYYAYSPSSTCSRPHSYNALAFPEIIYLLRNRWKETSTDTLSKRPRFIPQ